MHDGCIVANSLNKNDSERFNCIAGTTQFLI